jgi:hypothetical protein
MMGDGIEDDEWLDDLTQNAFFKRGKGLRWRGTLILPVAKKSR